MTNHVIPPNGSIVRYVNKTTNQVVWGIAEKDEFWVLWASGRAYVPGVSWPMTYTVSRGWTRDHRHLDDAPDEVLAALAKWRLTQ